MSTTTLPNFRTTSDITARVRLKDGGLAIDWSGLTDIKAWLYSDDQRAIAGRFAVSVSQEDPAVLVCDYSAQKPQYLGPNRIIVQAKYNGRTKTYDKPLCNLVRWTEGQEGETITIDDPEVDVEIEVEDVSSSILDAILDAMLKALDEAKDIVDIHRGPKGDTGETGADGKSAYEVAVDNGFVGTEEEWLDSLEGAQGKRGPAGVTSVQASVDATTGTPSVVADIVEGVLSMAFSGLKGETGPQGAQGIQGIQGETGATGATPVFTVGTVTTGEPGTPVVVTITGTAEAPVLNLTIPQGMQGNTGSSVDYAYELVNNLTTDDATKGLSAAQGVVLDGKISQLRQEVDDISTGKYYGYFAKEEDLPEADVDGFAYVGEGPTYTIYNLRGGVWTSSDITVNQSPVGNDEDIDQNEDGKLQFANRTYNAQQPNGMGYKVLRKDATFASQVTDTNTIYEIRYPFALSADFTMPSGCVLRFDGGSISGAYTLIFNNTEVQGNAEINCGLSGTINGIVNVAWFGLKADDSSFDNGSVINKVASVFKNLYIPNLTLFFSSPLVFNNIATIESFATLNYVGTNMDCAAIKITNVTSGDCRFLGTISGYENRGRLDFSGDGGTNVRGIEIMNCNNSEFYFSDINYSNEGLRLVGDGGGCSYNAIQLRRIRNTNRAIRIYQDNGGWANENKFYNGRLYNESGFVSSTRNIFAVYIKGPGTASDTYNSVNSLLFFSQSMEGYNQTCAIFAHRTNYSKFSRIRAEGVTTLIKFSDSCTGNEVDWSYIGTTLYNAADATEFPFTKNFSQRFLVKKINLLDFKQCYKNGNADTHWATPNTTFIYSRQISPLISNYSNSMSVSGDKRQTGQWLPGVILDISKTKAFFVKATDAVRFVVYYLEKTNGTAIDLGPDQENYLSPLGGFVYYSSVYGYMSGVNKSETFIFIRDSNIKKIGIVVNGTLSEFEIYSYENPEAEIPLTPVPTGGDTASRPQYAYPGQQYFDTTLGKTIVWNGTAWVNMDGSALA